MVQCMVTSSLCFILQNHSLFQIKIYYFSGPQISYWLVVGWWVVCTLGEWLFGRWSVFGSHWSIGR